MNLAHSPPAMMTDPPRDEYSTTHVAENLFQCLLIYILANCILNCEFDTFCKTKRYELPRRQDFCKPDAENYISQRTIWPVPDAARREGGRAGRDGRKDIATRRCSSSRQPQSTQFYQLVKKHHGQLGTTAGALCSYPHNCVRLESAIATIIRVQAALIPVTCMCAILATREQRTSFAENVVSSFTKRVRRVWVP